MSKIMGLDVSKNWLDACVYEQNIAPAYKRFANDKDGHDAKTVMMH